MRTILEFCDIDTGYNGGGGGLGAVVEVNGGQKASEFYVKIDFGSGKGAALEIQQAWWRQRRQGRRGVKIWGRERWVSGLWDRYR